MCHRDVLELTFEISADGVVWKLLCTLLMEILRNVAVHGLAGLGDLSRMQDTESSWNAWSLYATTLNIKTRVEESTAAALAHTRLQICLINLENEAPH